MALVDTKYFVFDIESIADGALVSRLRYPGQDLPPAEAIAKYRAELMAENGKDFVPYTFQLPISLVIAKVAKDLSLQDLIALDEKESRPHEIARLFWEGWRRYNRPRLVSFNGRGFDMPLLELCAFRYGIAIPDWFAEDARNFDQPRYRYNTAAHFDLYEWVTNSGASRFTGGLSLAATWRRTFGMRGGPPRSTTIAAVTCSTPTSCSCGRGCLRVTLISSESTR